MNYQESLDWIHSKLKFGIKPGLRRMTWLLERLGNPQDRIRGVHIIGTNGKGSTLANLQHIFTASGYKVGSFTSPYIMDFRERIAVDGQMISQEALINLVDRVYALVEELPQATGLEPATEFEIITVMMFLYFAEIEPVDLVLVEAGLGGRLDSTNVFQPLAVVCPSIGLDHQDILGETYAAIAEEKAGAIKAEVPFVFAADREEVRQVFVNRCAAVEAPAYELGRAFQLTDGLYQDKSGVRIAGIQPGLPGQHQVANAGLAIQTSLLLQPAYPDVTAETIRQGLAATSWLGRTELISPQLMLDGAHNRESIAALADLLERDYSARQIHILFAALDSKPVEAMLERLAALGRVTVTSFDYPKAVKLEAYPAAYERAEDFRDWLAAVPAAGPDAFYLVTGSLYFIAQVRQHLLKSREK